jgi:glyoxylase-like metal-dependent hydrolase (beta-lactamase superfamily II)
MREVTSELLNCGSCYHPEKMTRRDAPFKFAEYAALPALIRHPDEGWILFDTGYDPAFNAATETFPERFYRWMTPVYLAPQESAATQLRARGLAPDDIAHVVISHFHADHIAGLRQFPRAQFHSAKAGFDAICAPGRLSTIRKGYLKTLLPANFAARAHFFEDARRAALPSGLHPFDDGADLLGDGSLLAVELPGHCAGHWGLVIADAKFGPHFFVADAAWSSEAIRRNVPPPAITTSFLGDTQRARETLHRLHTLSQRAPDVRLTPYHCPERARETKSP